MGLARCCLRPRYDDDFKAFICSFDTPVQVELCRVVLLQYPVEALTVACTTDYVATKTSGSMTKFERLGNFRRFLLLFAILGLCVAHTVPPSSKICVNDDIPEQHLYASIAYYSDPVCQFGIGQANYFGPPKSCFDQGLCYPASISASGDVWGQVSYMAPDIFRLDITEGQDCTSGQGSQATIATFMPIGTACVQLTGVTGKEGVMLWPLPYTVTIGQNKRQSNSSSKFETAMATARLQLDQNEALNVVKREKRQECTGFDIESSKTISTESLQVSSGIVRCVGLAACVIDETQTGVSFHSSSLRYLDASGSVYNVKKTFGDRFANQLRTESQNSLTIPDGQAGFVSAYVKATLFLGRFTQCEDGSQDNRQGHVVALHENGLVYRVVLVNY